MVINFPTWAKTTPCKTRTRSYWNTALSKRMMVTEKIQPLTKVRVVSTRQLVYVPTRIWALDLFEKFITCL